MISIHALRVEGDFLVFVPHVGGGYFYPRPPGGGRPMKCSVSLRRFYFYPRPPGGGRHVQRQSGNCRGSISIHALRVEGDRRIFFFVTGSRISIHALRVEGDHRHFVRCFFGILNFYPRPPGGGRLVSAGDGGSVAVFLSTPSGWRATNLVTVNGGDVIFLSTPSGWRATGNAPAGQAGSPISIHALRVEGDSLLTAYSKDT